MHLTFHLLLHLLLHLILHLILHVMLHRCLLVCLHLVVAQLFDGIHATLLNTACLPVSFISCSMLTFAQQPLFSFSAPLLPKCLLICVLQSVSMASLSLSRCSLREGGQGSASIKFSESQEIGLPNSSACAEDARHPNSQGTEPNEISQANIPKQKISNGRSQSTGP